MLRLARASLEAALAGAAPPAPPHDPAVSVRHGAFVSLHTEGRLRGCIGQVTSDHPLGDLVARMAVAAAQRDPRFPPVTAGELPGLRIEISVLGEPVPLHPRDPAAIAIGRHGVLVRRGEVEAILLPQVAPEHGWTAEDFLAATCRKAGLGAHAWREPDSEVFVFEADFFGEE